MAAAGIASRRACETLIFDGNVTVNGKIVLIPQTLVDGDKDNIMCHGEHIKKISTKVTYILNKPVGYVCSSARGRHSRIVLDLFAKSDLRLFTVGRLDKDTGGLLLVTNDGQLSNEIIHPRSNIEKEYLVKADKEISHNHLKSLSEGAIIEGVMVKPVKVTKVRKATFKIIVKEGKKREIRLLAREAGLRVRELTRIRIGGLLLGALLPGAKKKATKREIDSIFSR